MNSKQKIVLISTIFLVLIALVYRPIVLNAITYYGLHLDFQFDYKNISILVPTLLTIFFISVSLYMYFSSIKRMKLIYFSVVLSVIFGSSLVWLLTSGAPIGNDSLMKQIALNQCYQYPNETDKMFEVPNNATERIEYIKNADNVNCYIGTRSLLSQEVLYGLETGDLSVIKALLEKGADVNLKGENSWVPIHYTANHSMLEKDFDRKIAQLLIENGADLNIQERDHGYSVLHMAADFNDQQKMRFFLDHGANPGLKDNDGKTAAELLSH